MGIKEEIKKIIRRRNPELIANEIAHSFHERKENGEKDPMDNTVEEIMGILKNNPDIERTILAKILENEELPNKIFEKAATEISKDEEIPDSVIIDAVNKADTDISDEIINNIIKEGEVNVKERLELLKNVEDKEILRARVENELKILYKNCKDRRDDDVVDRIKEIQNLLNPEDINSRINQLVDTVIAKKMAENYYNDFKKGTNIYTLSKIIPSEEMIEKDLPTIVEKEFKLIEEEKGVKPNRFNKIEFKKLILDELGKQIGIKYTETGVFIVPQSKKLKEITDEEKMEFIKAIQIYARRPLTREEIISIDEQIKGTSQSIQIKENKIINLIKKIPNEEKNKKIDMLTEIIQDPKMYDTIKQLQESGLLEKIEKMPKEKREKTIGIINSSVEQRNKYNVTTNIPKVKKAIFNKKTVDNEEER